MKIGIVTVYKSENCGSYFQAWALKSTLEKMGASPYFMPYKNYKESNANIAFQIIKSCLKLRFGTANFLLNRKIKFKRARKNFKVIKDKESLDTFIFGSDTIWNFSDPIFYKNRFIFTGKRITKPRYTYAVSCGSTPPNYFYDEDIKKEIAAFNRISVRDDHIKQILENLFPERQFVRVVDPTLLLETKDYDKLASSVPSVDNYFLVYYFGKISDKLFKIISDFAKRNSLKLVKIGAPDKRFDINVTNNPHDFISYFKSAKYVLTNTFHGCVFSVIFNRQFITDGLYKMKIEDFINRYDLQSQHFNDYDSFTIEPKLTTPINYKKINAELSKDREISLRFLKEVVSLGSKE